MTKNKQKLIWRNAKWRVRDLKEFRGNPQEQNAWSENALGESIDEFNLVETPVVDIDGTLLAGHGRKKTLMAKGRGDEMIDVRVPSRPLTKRERKRYLLISNAVRGSFNPDLLKSFDTSVVLDVIDPGTLSNLWDNFLDTEDDGFDEEVEKKKIKRPTVLPGEFWRLGEHTLGCVDGTDEQAVRKLVGASRINFSDVDPPFSIGWSYRGKNNKYGGSEKDDRSPEEYRAFLGKLVKNCVAVSAESAHYMMWCDERFVGLVQQLFEEHGIAVERLCLWAKNNAMPTPAIAFSKATEFAVYGRIGVPHLNDDLKNLNTFQNKELGTGNRLVEDLIDLYSVWLVKRLAGTAYEHPTQKPVSLYEKALRRVTKVGDNVLDLCAGSGSLMVACEQMKRRAFLAEIDPVFATLIKNRYEQLTNKKARKIN